jgi:hypothetical protein
MFKKLVLMQPIFTVYALIPLVVVASLCRLWNMISDFSASRKEWLHGSFLDLNGVDIERDVSEWCKSRYCACM